MPFTKNDIKQLIDFIHFFKPREKFGIYYQNISIIGICCFFLISVGLNGLLIPINILIWIGIISTVTITILFSKFYKRELGIIWAFIHNVTIGIIVVFLFIKSNDLLSVNEIKIKDYYIYNLELEYHRANRSGSYLVPVITVRINGSETKLKLSAYYFKDVQKTKYVRIGIKNGFWNYPIIKSVQLVEYEKDTISGKLN